MPQQDSDRGSAQAIDQADFVIAFRRAGNELLTKVVKCRDPKDWGEAQGGKTMSRHRGLSDPTTPMEATWIVIRLAPNQEHQRECFERLMPLALVNLLKEFVRL